MATILGSVEDERCFSLLSFIKNKLKNQLTIHLELVMWMYAQFFYIGDLPIDYNYQILEPIEDL
jgi:hypothetical protein